MMKFKKITLLISIISITAFGQTEKGKFILGGMSNLGSSYLTEGNSGYTTISSSFSIATNTGYAVMDNFFIGINIQYLKNRFKIKNFNSESTTKIFVVSPFLKYYFLTEKFRPFTVIRYGLGKNKYHNIDSSGDYSSTSDLTKISLGGGVSYFFTDYFSLEFEAVYQKDSTKYEYSESNYDGFSTNLGFSIFL